MIELVYLQEEEERSELAPAATWEDSCLQTRKRALTRTQSCWHPNSVFLTSRTGRNKFCLRSSVSGIALGSLSRLKLKTSHYRISRSHIKTEERARKKWGDQAGVYCTEQAREDAAVGLSLGSQSRRNSLMQTDIFNSSMWGSSEYKSVTPFSGS